ncbi:MAG: glycine cleavage system protein H [Desulfatiglans sp.]|jgi:glycine cleavage system H lipoate-binding protein|nr:glycine cleavage system protein H [Desulfatiglans sp.]
MAEKSKKTSLRIVPPGKKRCVWMEAGVVSYKLCDNNYDCSTCAYDHGMQLKVSRQKQSSMGGAHVEMSPDKFTGTWAEKMMLLPASQRKCRYMITGEVERKICPNAYECGNCSFDQMMQARQQAEPATVHRGRLVAGFEMAEGIYYHEGHTWARPEYGGRVRVGFDDFAQKIMGNLSRIELPSVGGEVKQGQAGIQVRRNGDMAKVLSPIDGIVTFTNNALKDHPELINESPYDKGWLCIIEPTKLRKNLKELLYGEEAEEFVREEKENLFARANEDMRIAADGGVSVDDIFEGVESKDWAEFVKTFLRS